MKHIWGSINPYYQNFDRQQVLGASSAAYSFVKALLDYGSFDEYHFFIENGGCDKQFLDFIDGLGLGKDSKNRIRSPHFDDMESAFRKGRYTAFHNWDPESHKLFYAREVFKPRISFPVVSFVHAIAPPFMYEKFVLDLLSDTKPYDVFICPSKALRTCMKKYFDEISSFFRARHGTNVHFKGSFEVIPLGIEDDIFKPRDKAELRKKFDIPPDKVIVSCITRLNPINKMELFPLLFAFASALKRTENKEALLLIVGKDQIAGYADSLKSIAASLSISDRLIVVSDPAKEDIPLYYSLSDIFISPSDNPQETFGLTPIEAMLSGLAVVVSDWNGYKEAVEDGDTGFKIPTFWTNCSSNTEKMSALKNLTGTLFPLGQSVALDNYAVSTLLAKLIDDPSLREKVGSGARRAARNKYSWKVVIKRLEKLYIDKSLEAAKDKERRDFSNTFLKVPYFKLFDHYPTALLDGKTKIKRTDYGSSVSDGSSKLLIHGLTAGILDIELCELLLSKCYSWTSIKKILSASKNRERELFHIMLLLKFGLLENKP